MLNALHQLAKRIYFARRLFLVLANIIAAFFIFAITTNPDIQDIYLQSSVALFGWFFCLYGIANGFITLPSSITGNDKFLIRLQKRIKLSMAFLFASLFMVCTLGLVYVSYLTVKLSVTSL